MRQSRIVPLECARGIASIIVVFHHCLLAFCPGLKDFSWRGGLNGTPIYFLVNGSGAVTFFFVLSGFVLAVGLYRNTSLENLAVAVVKRLPRLLVPACASVFLGFLVLRHAGDQYLPASALSGSAWLRDFGNAMFPEHFAPSALDALNQSLLVFLVPNRAYYNSNLWTMFSEFHGSLLVFAIVGLFGFGRMGTHRTMVLLHLVLIVLFTSLWPSFVPFVAGSFMAYQVARSDAGLRVSTGWAWVLLAGAVLGFAVEWWPANMLASIFVILALLGHRGLADWLSGPVGAFLGRLSFPLYLVHLPVVLSVSSFVFAGLLSAGSSMVLAFWAALLVTVAASVLAALPFMLLDTVWVRWLNEAARGLVRRLIARHSEGWRAGSGISLERD